MIANAFMCFSAFVQDILSHIKLRTEGIGDVFLTHSESILVHFSLFAWFFKRLTEQSELCIEKAISQ